MNGESYLISLNQMLPELLQDVPIAISNLMWFQHNGASVYFSTVMSTYLNATFGAGWIGRGGPVLWPPRSPDYRTSITFYGAI